MNHLLVSSFLRLESASSHKSSSGQMSRYVSGLSDLFWPAIANIFDLQVSRCSLPVWSASQSSYSNCSNSAHSYLSSHQEQWTFSTSVVVPFQCCTNICIGQNPKNEVVLIKKFPEKATWTNLGVTLQVVQMVHRAARSLKLSIECLNRLHHFTLGWQLHFAWEHLSYPSGLKLRQWKWYDLQSVA